MVKFIIQKLKAWQIKQKNLPYNSLDFSEVIFSIKDMDKTKCKDGDHMDAEWTQKHEEIAVVPSTYAIVDPRAVMVKSLQRKNMLLLLHTLHPQPTPLLKGDSNCSCQQQIFSGLSKEHKRHQRAVCVCIVYVYSYNF